MTLGDLIREYTAEHSMTAFLKDSGLSKAYTYMLINNRNNNGAPIVPSIETIKKVSNGIHRDFNEVFSILDPDMKVTTKDDSGETSNYHDGYYLDEETAKVAQEVFDDPDLRVLFDAARGSRPEDIRMAADMLRRFKETNPDG